MHVLFEGLPRAVDAQLQALGGEEAEPWEELRELQARPARPRALGRAGGAARASGPARRLRRAGTRAGVEPARRARAGGDVQPELIADCVHCGFCLPTCPTYSLWHEEMDSPRGRIYLMQGLVDGTISLTDTVVEHFDRCLGCMACVSSCPSGVQYDRLIEQTRDYVERNHRRSPVDRLVRAGIFAVFPASAAAARGAALPQAAGARPAPAAEADRAALGRAGVAAGAPAERRAAGRAARRLRRERRLRRRQRGDRARPARRGLRRPRAARAGLLRCAARARGTARAGRRARPQARAGPGRLRPHRHERRRLRLAPQGSRRRERRRRLGAARRTARGAPAAAAARRVPGLVPPPSRAGRHVGAARDARRDPGARAARAGRAGDLLRQRRHLQHRRGRTAAELGDRKAVQVLATAPDAYASGNPGCLVQVTAAMRRAGRPTPAFHPIELVDASIRGLAAASSSPAPR